MWQVSDATYAWGLMNTFTEQIHGRIRAEPLTVLKLQCLFIKLRSIMDIPLLRISQCNRSTLIDFFALLLCPLSAVLHVFSARYCHIQCHDFLH